MVNRAPGGGEQYCEHYRGEDRPQHLQSARCVGNRGILVPRMGNEAGAQNRQLGDDANGGSDPEDRLRKRLD